MWPWAWRRPFCIFWGRVLTGPLDRGRRARVRGGGPGPGQRPEAGNAGKRIACGQLAPRPPARGHGRGSSRCVRVSCDGTTGHSRLSGGPAEIRRDHPWGAGSRQRHAAERPTPRPSLCGAAAPDTALHGASAHHPFCRLEAAAARTDSLRAGAGARPDPGEGSICVAAVLNSHPASRHLLEELTGDTLPPQGSRAWALGVPMVPAAASSGGHLGPNGGAPANQLEEHRALRDKSCFQGGRDD